MQSIKLISVNYITYHWIFHKVIVHFYRQLICLDGGHWHIDTWFWTWMWSYHIFQEFVLQMNRSNIWRVDKVMLFQGVPKNAGQFCNFISKNIAYRISICWPRDVYKENIMKIDSEAFITPGYRWPLVYNHCGNKSVYSPLHLCVDAI